MCALFWAFEIEHVKLATRFEDAPDRAQGLDLLVRWDVVEHERGQHTVEGHFGIGKLVAKTLVKADRYRCAGPLPSGSGERLRVGIESNGVGLWIEAF